MRYISFMADKAGLTINGRAMTHGGSPAGVIRDLQSAYLTGIKYNGAPELQSVNEVITVETSRVRRDGYLATAFPPRQQRTQAGLRKFTKF